ncbi:hypothetical protein SI65_05916 [Aspergillus cristatus]|uniref:Uncharacterized protein n=1 Tax=Aspergillus cristatus TaxID=573508 RepID=A0A1E3BED2_ASPCR|nr:hypothetical protein SI65_05916 [Aspergillus cristatus]
MTSGIFVFAPTQNNILKVMRHGYGYETTMANQRRTKSGPKLLSSQATSNFIPDEADAALRAGFAFLLPRFKDRPWIKRRLCWYSDTRDANFIIDRYPSISGMFLVTGIVGNNAFKFLPILGRYVSNIFEGRGSDVQRQRWALKPTNKPMSKGDGSRGGPVRRVLTYHEQAKL